MKSNTIYSVIICIVIVLIAFALETGSYYNYKFNGNQIIAKVVNFEEKRVKYNVGSKREESRFANVATIEYKINKKNYKVEKEITGKRLNIGEEVKIYYFEKNPENIVIEGSQIEGIKSAIYTSMIIIMCLLAPVMIFKNK